MRSITLLALVSTFAWGAESPDAMSLVTQSAKAISAFSSYKMEQHMTIDMQGSGISDKMSLDMQLWAQPGRFRVRTSAASIEVLAVSDGSYTYLYMGGPFNQYLKKPATDSPEKLGETIMPGVAGFANRAKEAYKSARIVREENVAFQGNDVPCYVVEVAVGKVAIPSAGSISNGKQTIWIDKERKLVLKQTGDFEMLLGAATEPMKTHQEMAMTSLDTAPGFAADDFKFTPPAGAKEVDSLPGMPAAK
jgi:outer membrane lipoprotein-sorting protein